MAITIPKPHHKFAVDLFHLSSEERESIAVALTKVEPELHIERLVSRIAEMVSVSREKLSGIFHVLGNIADLIEGSRKGPDHVISELVCAFRELKEIRDDPQEAWDLFVVFLNSVFSTSNAIAVTAKARRVMTAYENVFIESDIFTDLRPVFPSGEIAGQPAAFVITHSLKVEFGNNSAIKDIFLAMDFSDLSSLKDKTERAMKKHQSLQEMMGSLHVSVLEDSKEVV